MDAFDGLLREGLVVTSIIALPMLLAAAAVGTVVAIVQAATQVQEQTLTLLPKIVAVGAMAALFGPFALALLARLFHDALGAIPQLIGMP